jgi:hypothetical protein
MSKSRYGLAFTCLWLLAVAALILAVLSPSTAQRRVRRWSGWSVSGSLHRTGLAMTMYRNDHGGEPPPDLQAVLSEYFPEDPYMLTDLLERSCIYRRRRGGAAATEPLVYLWPLLPDGTVTILRNNPQQRPPAGSGALIEPAFSNVVNADLTTEDLAVAARQARWTPEHMLYSHRWDLVNAVRLYAEEHDGRFPESLTALLEAGYITDELAWHLEREGVRYVQPRSDKPDEMVACVWPPEGKQTPVLLMNTATSRAGIEVEIVNPRNGDIQEVILEGGAPQTTAAHEAEGRAP